LQKQDDEDGQL